MMKKLYLFLMSAVCLLAALSSPAQKPLRALLTGSVDNYKGEGYLLCVFRTDKETVYDTINIDSNGRFRFVKDLPEPTIAGIYLEYLGDDRTIIEAYMVNGTESKVKITSSEKEGRLVSIPEFYGDNKGESSYLRELETTTMGGSFALEKAVPMTFKDYQAYISKEIARLRTLLSQAKAQDFKTEHLAELARMERTVPFRFAWAKRNAGLKMDADPDFIAYVKSFDLNDLNNLGITEQILRWYMGCTPDPDEPNNMIREMKLMKEMIKNQDVINQLANQMMEMELATGGSEYLKAIYGQYCRTSTDTASIRAFTLIYNQLSKLLPGVEASDFEMQTVDGKTVRFREVIGQGKITYIDFWATWCGPCCAEIPYVEKLVEKYKNNPNIEFISISLDNDVRKWHKKLEQDRPAWRQFVIPENFNSAFAKEYNITAIPRFMMFDKDGKIININAPRPSDEQIDTFLQKYLK